MVKIPLEPYPGEVHLTRDFKEFTKLYKLLMEEEYEGEQPYGATSSNQRPGYAPIYLVYAKRGYTSTLTHEFSHVLLMLFEHIQLSPNVGNGEPFAYMISHLMNKAGIK